MQKITFNVKNINTPSLEAIVNFNKTATDLIDKVNNLKENKESKDKIA